LIERQSQAAVSEIIIGFTTLPTLAMYQFICRFWMLRAMLLF